MLDKLKKDKFGKAVQPGYPVGTTLAYYGSVVPTGYLTCNGTDITLYFFTEEDLDKVIEEYWN